MDLYHALGVRPNATALQIRRAFQKLARLCHPALNPADPTAVARYGAITQAFAVLSDPPRRAAYDRGDLVLTPARAVPDVGFEGFDFATEVRTEVAGFREIFESTQPASQRDTLPSPGEELRLTTRITFAEAFHGAQRRVHVVRQDVCPTCRGSGEAETEPVPCQPCEGSGQVRARRGHMVFRRPCADCGGVGSIRRQTCTRCHAEGRLIQSEWLDVTIPPGVGDGSEVRVPGCGNAGRRGGTCGDLVLRVEAEAHRLYAREGTDLHCVVPITFPEAALGEHIEVPTPDGSMRIEIPSGTQTGQRFRLRGRGMPRLGEKGRGDFFIEVRVLVPAIREGRGRELLEELARMHTENPRAELLASALAEGAVGLGRGARSGAQEAGDAARKTVAG